MRPSFEHLFLHRAAGIVIRLDWPATPAPPRSFRQRLRDALTGAHHREPWEDVDSRSFEAAVDLLNLTSTTPAKSSNASATVSPDTAFRLLPARPVGEYGCWPTRGA